MPHTEVAAENKSRGQSIHSLGESGTGIALPSRNILIRIKAKPAPAYTRSQGSLMN